MRIYLTVIVKSKVEFQDEIKNMLYNLPELSRKESACIKYDVHQSIDAENIFVLNEVWESLEGLDHHNRQPYSQAFFESFDKLEENPLIFRSR
ncbi:antibiotic biosynthesis monooxygenase [Flavobacterium sp. HMWF030]|nr:antibiotic biosynthesis monooxygenase [Flavobacterium sp. HMWF030]